MEILSLEVRVCTLEDGESYAVLCNDPPHSLASRESLQDLIELLHRTVRDISDAQLEDWGKKILLEETPEYFPYAYSRDDPLWKAYRRQHPAERPGRLPLMGFVYIVQSGRHYKIGCSATPAERIKALRLQAPRRRLRTIGVISTPNMRQTERELHTRYTARRTDGEWFRLTAEDLAGIQQDYVVLDLASLSRSSTSNGSNMGGDASWL